MIVITTPTGNIGRQVLARVLQSGEAVRVVARDPSRLSAEVHGRAEVVQGSHGDADVIAKALAGADSLFWLVPPPSFQSSSSAEEYYLNFTRPLVQAGPGQGVRVVGVTSLGHGYPGKAGLLSAALAMDALIEGAGVSYRAVALPFFMENLLHQVRDLKGQGRFSMANTADRPLLTVATRDAATAAAALLLDSSWSGQARVPVASPDTLPPDAMAEVISDVLGRPIRYQEVPVADYQATMQQYGASPAMALGMAEMTDAQNNGIYDAEPLSPNSTGATSFRQWCQDTLKPAIEA
ncbi:NmrA family NAD(P)-binding protein [Dactylosporangium sp. CA-092794]|uniref:NmrA family NAD(P)-binding protein n=1 Tax=Dactylosporangium sp. CA-092794 TaxID=3239929 RepID=UPI003D93C9BF